MCWNCYKSECLKPITAESDVKVFKIALKLDNHAAVPYYMSGTGIIYRVGLTYEAEIGSPGLTGRISEGLHCYSQLQCGVTKTQYRFIDVYNLTLHGNIAVYADDLIVILHCIIPKGATYYLNDIGEIVTEKLIVKSISKPSDVLV